MRGIILREAKPADIPGMLGLYGQNGYDDGRVLDIKTATAILEKTAYYPFYRFYVAEEGDSIVGTFALLVMDNIGHMGAPSAVVESVAVAPAHQGTGVGRHMMTYSMQVARSHGCYKLALSSSDKRHRAHEFYEKIGFTRHGASFQVILEEEVQQ